MMKRVLLMSCVLVVFSTNLLAQINEQATTKIPVFGDNTISLSVGAIDFGIAFSLSYERLITVDKKISFILPVTFMLGGKTNQYVGGGGLYSPHPFIYLTPGMKYYPTGQGKVTYAVGLNLMLGYTKMKGNIILENGATSIDVVNHVYKMGLLLNNYINFQLSPVFSIGLSAAPGLVLVDYDKVTGGMKKDCNFPMLWTFEGKLSFGFRF